MLAHPTAEKRASEAASLGSLAEMFEVIGIGPLSWLAPLWLSDTGSASGVSHVSQLLAGHIFCTSGCEHVL